MAVAEEVNARKLAPDKGFLCLPKAESGCGRQKLTRCQAEENSKVLSNSDSPEFEHFSLRFEAERSIENDLSGAATCMKSCK